MFEVPDPSREGQSPSKLCQRIGLVSKPPWIFSSELSSVESTSTRRSARSPPTTSRISPFSATDGIGVFLLFLLNLDASCLLGTSWLERWVFSGAFEALGTRKVRLESLLRGLWTSDHSQGCRANLLVGETFIGSYRLRSIDRTVFPPRMYTFGHLFYLPALDSTGHQLRPETGSNNPQLTAWPGGCWYSFSLRLLLIYHPASGLLPRGRCCEDAGAKESAPAGGISSSSPRKNATGGGSYVAHPILTSPQLLDKGNAC